LADLRGRYSDEYPDVTQTSDKLTLVRQELTNLPADSAVASRAPEPEHARPAKSANARLLVTNNEIAHLQAEQQEILRQINEYQTKVEAAPLLEQEFSELGRDYRDASVRYQSLMDKTLTADMAEQMERTHEADRFSILEPAQLPDKPFRPHRLRWIFLGIPACFLFAAFLGVFTDIVVRGTIGTEWALQSVLPESIPVIGRIPEMETEAKMRRQRQLAFFAISGVVICCLVISLFLLRLKASA
jgi:uncharacterized protein involved in exopolysaccharide biosynthesis